MSTVDLDEETPRERELLDELGKLQAKIANLEEMLADMREAYGKCIEREKQKEQTIQALYRCCKFKDDSHLSLSFEKI